MLDKLLTLLLLLTLCTQIKAQTFSSSNFVEIKGGTFTMGELESDYEGPPGSYDAPVTTITLSDFWMSATEITNQQYVDFLNAAYTAGLLEVKVETAMGPDNGFTLVYGSPSAPDDYKGIAIVNLSGARVMKDHNNDDGDNDPFTGVIEPENPLNISYIGFDDSKGDGEKFFVKDPAQDFDWMELTNYYNYTTITYELDTSTLLNDFEAWDELKDLPNNLPTLEEVKNWPATFIRWYGAKAFALFYNLDLPTEAQWEYAAKGGNDYKYATNDGNVNEDGTSANWNWAHEEPALHHVYDVKLNDPNPYGLYNMAGNVWEWVEDWYASDFYTNATDPVNTNSASNKKVRRGGSWNYHKSTLKTAARAEDERFKGNDHFGFRVVSNPGLTSIENKIGVLPGSFKLFGNYPNPFNPSTKIRFELPEKQRVVITVYNSLGEKVTELLNSDKPKGIHEVTWNAGNLTSGIYFYKIAVRKDSKIWKLVLLK